MSVFIIFGILSAVALSGFFSGIETAIYSVNTIDLQISAAKGSERSQRVLNILRNKSRLITTMLVGTNLAIYIATNLLTNFLNHFPFRNTEVLTTLILTPFCFVFAESLPKRLAFGVANRALVMSAKAISFFEIIFLPVSYVLGGLAGVLRFILSKAGLKDSLVAGRMRLFENLEAKVAEGGLSMDQYRLATRIMQIDSVLITKFTLKVKDTFTIYENTACEKAGRSILANGYARSLLVDDNGELTGDIVTINSIIANKDKGDNIPVKSIAEKAFCLDKNTSVLHAISGMRQNGSRIAIVVSKKNNYIGTIQLNTLLNSIVSLKR